MWGSFKSLSLQPVFTCYKYGCASNLQQLITHCSIVLVRNMASEQSESVRSQIVFLFKEELPQSQIMARLKVCMRGGQCMELRHFARTTWLPVTQEVEWIIHNPQDTEPQPAPDGYVIGFMSECEVATIVWMCVCEYVTVACCVRALWVVRRLERSIPFPWRPKMIKESWLSWSFLNSNLTSSPPNIYGGHLKTE